MKKVDLAQTLQLIGNAGVIAGILLLVYELNQNRQMMQAQTRNELSQSIIDQFLDAAGNEGLTDVVIKGQSGALTEESDRRRYDWWLLARFRYWENVHYQYRNGLYEEEEFAAQAEAFIPTFRLPGVEEWWSNRAIAFSPEFVSWVEEQIARSPE